ncbi:L-proline glycine betaine ABC transport system permease protein ProV [Cutibacterium acnes JCM 18918]|nr:L-proline glycine betaine ABC transport system permease protein ProV [Cutibacterium acnes JCM 18918]
MIRFDHVSKRFDDGTVAVDNFELTVESHHLVVLLGSSGCGKTTLLRMVNRMVDPSEGRILIDDTDVATVNPVKLRRQIGYVMQSGGLLPHRTVVDNIAAVPLLSGVSRTAARTRAMDLLERVGSILPWRVDTPPNYQAGSDNESGWHAPWPPTPTSSSWTSLSVLSTRWCGPSYSRVCCKSRRI